MHKYKHLHVVILKTGQNMTKFRRVFGLVNERDPAKQTKASIPTSKYNLFIQSYESF